MSSDRFGRIRKRAAQEVEDHAASHLGDSVRQFPMQLWIHRAHVVMLAKEGILRRDEAARILKALSSVEKDVEKAPLLSVYMNTEGCVIAKAGEVGGKMHIGRSRNDLGATTQRMYVREMVNDLYSHLILFRKALLEKAEEHSDTIMIGYTHWQQAQPITLGHYLLAHADACERCLTRLDSAYSLVNLNTLGAAALAGTGWPINRRTTTELLGFDGVLENTLDCVASRDFLADLAGAAAILMTNLSRLAEDLEIWTSQEFSTVELDDSYANTSSIMPQKKNPGTLEVAKAHAASAVGDLTSILTSLKSASYTNVGDVAEAVQVLRRMVEDTVITLRIMRGVVSTLRVDRELMLKKAYEGFGTMTELADTIVRERDLSFRLAHEIVAQGAAKAIQEGRIASDLTSDIIDEAAREVVGKPLSLPEEMVQRALDPRENVRARSLVGGPAPEEVKRMIADRWRRVRDEGSRLEERRSRLKKSIENLRKEETEIVGH